MPRVRICKCDKCDHIDKEAAFLNGCPECGGEGYSSEFVRVMSINELWHLKRDYGFQPTSVTPVRSVGSG